MDDRRILDQYPLPLARAYRRYLNATETRVRHDAAYYLFEVLLKYLAATAISFYLHRAERDHRVNAALKGLARPSFGEWLRFLRESLRFLGDSEDPDLVVTSLLDLLDDRRAGWREVLELANALRSFRLGTSSAREKVNLAVLFDEIVSYRNRVLGHGAPLGDEHYQRFASLFGRAFPELVDLLPFLTARRLVSFDAPRVQDASRVECSYVEYVGLQPLRRDEPLRLEYGAPTPVEDRLYLLSETGQFVSLDPFLLAHEEDVYILNEARGEPEYLSYSSGARHRRSNAGETQKELFERILGYRLDATRLSQIGEEVAVSAELQVAAGEEGADRERRLGDYRIVREIGRGGMGTVFEAVQGSLGRRVALKVLPGSFALDVKRLERFRREARATARIHHPSIVPVYEVGETSGTHFYAMEFLDGTSLDQAIELALQEVGAKPSGRSSSISDPGYIASAVEQIASLAEGLEEAHRQGLVHRDIKPSNIIVERSGRYVLVDFGLVHDAGADTITRSGEMVGTLCYMSPEQVSRRRVDARSDVYSLGATLYEVLTLRPPVGGESDPEIQNAILFDEPVPPRRLNSRINRDLETVVLHALEKKPDRRYGSAAELAADLRRFLRYEPVRAKPRSLVSRIAQRAWRRKGTLAAAGVILVLGVTAALFWSWLARESYLRRIAEYEPAVLEAIGRMQLGVLRTVSESGAITPVSPEGAREGAVEANPMRQALEGLTRAIDLVPDRPEAYYHRARVYVNLRRFDEALDDIDQVLDIDPGFVAARLLRSKVHTEQGDPSKARIEMERARVAADSEWEQAWVTAQDLLEDWWNGSVKAAEEYDRILRLAEGEELYLGAELEMRLGRGQARLLSGDFLGALVDLRVVADRNPQAIEPVLLEGETYILSRQAERAEEVFRTLFDRVPERLKDEVVLRVSQIYEARGKYDRAREWAEKLAGGIRKHAMLAAIFRSQGEYQLAVFEVKTLLEKEPRDARWWYGLGELERPLGNSEEAMRCYRQALEYDPELADAHLRLGGLLDFRGERADAIAHLEEAVRLDPLLTDARVELARAYVQAGRDEDALREVCAAVPHAFNLDFLRNFWTFLREKPGVVAAASAEFAVALEQLERDRSISRGDDVRLKTLALGWTYHPDRKDRDKALRFAREAVEEGGRADVEAFRILAEVQEHFGDLSGAILTLEDAVRQSVRNAGLDAQLEQYRTAYRPKAGSYASIDAWLEAVGTETLISEGAEWRFFRGREEPSTDLAWTALDFPDDAWERGASGIGYGDGDDRTTLDDMRGSYTTVYLRHRFTVVDPETIETLDLSIDIDDGFVAYLNGEEVARVRAGGRGQRLAFDALATAPVADAIRIRIALDPQRLRAGANCLAIQGLNVTLTSSDLSVIPALSCRRLPDPEKEREILRRCRAAAGGAEARQRARYLEARILDRAGERAKAREIFRELVESDPDQPEPVLRLAESLRGSGNALEAARELRRRLEAGIAREERLWELWAEISRENLARSPGDLLRALPAEPALRYRFGGEAHWDAEEGYFVLTPSESGRTGRVFCKVPLPLERWTARFELLIDRGRGMWGGGDGMTFAFVRMTDYPPAAGGNLDFGGEGWAVEFDAYGGRGEPAEGHHVGIIQDDYANHLAVHELPGGLAHGVWHPVRIEFELGRITVWLDGRDVISGFEIPAFEPFTGYFGFTASTGASFERHLVRNLRFEIPESESDKAASGDAE